MKVKELTSSSIPSRLRLGLTLTIVLAVISSSPVIVLDNIGFARPSSHSYDPTPSTIGQDGSDFTTQAALGSVTARPTNNIVTTTSFYDIVFVTTTAGAIKTIEVTFPAGTQMPATPLLNEVEGIGPGTSSRSGQTIIYTVANAVNVPAGTRIRLEIANINNPVNPSTSYTVSVTTKDATNTPIDGPTPSTAFTMKQLGASVIAPGSITNTRIADGAVTTSKIVNGAIAPFVIQRPSLSNPVSVPPNDFSPVTQASCLAGEQAVGGGLFTFGSAARFLRLVESTQANSMAWQVQMVNEDTVNAWSFGVVVECMPALP